MRCLLCGWVTEQRLFVAAQGEACNDCISNLIDNEVERRMERQSEQESGRDYQSEFRDRQIAAQQLKR